MCALQAPNYIDITINMDSQCNRRRQTTATHQTLWAVKNIDTLLRSFSLILLLFEIRLVHLQITLRSTLAAVKLRPRSLSAEL